MRTLFPSGLVAMMLLMGPVAFADEPQSLSGEFLPEDTSAEAAPESATEISLSREDFMESMEEDEESVPLSPEEEMLAAEVAPTEEFTAEEEPRVPRDMQLLLWAFAAFVIFGTFAAKGGGGGGGKKAKGTTISKDYDGDL